MKRQDWLAVAKNVLKECKRGLADGIRDDDGNVCVMAAISIATGHSTREDISDNPDCVHRDLRSLGIELNDGNAWKDENARGEGMAAFAVACLNTAKHKRIEKFWDYFKMEYFRTVVPLIVENFSEKPFWWNLIKNQVESATDLRFANKVLQALNDFDNDFNLHLDSNKSMPLASLASLTDCSSEIMKATCAAATTAIKKWRKESAGLLKLCKLK